LVLYGRQQIVDVRRRTPEARQILRRIDAWLDPAMSQTPGEGYPAMN
jgi:hypothetical protein